MKNYIIVLLLITVVSCKENLIKKPDNLISENEMTAILYDLAIMSAANNTNSTILLENNIKTMPYIYTKYKIDSVQFSKSDLFYASDPTVYESIFKEVQKRLDKEQKIIQDARDVIRDSIDKVRTDKIKKKEEKKPKNAPLKKPQK